MQYTSVSNQKAKEYLQTHINQYITRILQKEEKNRISSN